MTGTCVVTFLVTQTSTGYEISTHDGVSVTIVFVLYHVEVPVTKPSTVLAVVSQLVLVS